MSRTAEINRETKETKVALRLDLEGGEAKVSTGIGFLDHMLELLAGRVTTAGCVFVGERSATAFGDYAAGSNHVLPTGGAGRFQGPLGPGAFRRRIATVEMTQDAARALAPTVATLARAEGFPLHAESVEARAKE